MIDDSEKRNRQLAFKLQNSHVCEKRSKYRHRKKIKAWKTEYEWLGNLCRAVKTKHLSWCFSHIKPAFFKSKLLKIH